MDHFRLKGGVVQVHVEDIGLALESEGAAMLACADVVRPGGWLVYATCSLEPEENEDQIEALLARGVARG